MHSDFNELNRHKLTVEWYKNFKMSQSNLDERDEESAQDAEADISSGGKSEEEIIELRK